MTKALILDCDGVIADTSAAHIDAANTGFAEAGVDVTWDEAMYARVSATAGLRGQLKAYFGRFGWPGGEADNIDLVDRIEAAHNRRFIERVRDGKVALRSDLISLIEHATGRAWRLAVCSEDHADLAAACVSRLGLGLSSRISIVLGGDAGLEPRPDPAPYLTIAEQMGVSPSDCTAIVARPFGVMAAKNAGFHALGLVGPGDNPLAFGGTPTIHSLDAAALEASLAA